ncbi:MAG: hypothetical protein JO117_05310 [Verrucomicrobia bacterium]|nr:hypothetical protein [Verrucomicrobiota bacterium]MBV9659516.1 hypothetical protein [Verrucomicrobiota bacterium]
MKSISVALTAALVGVLACVLGWASAARADVTAVKVAVVNGQPIYHSKVLVSSRMTDDIDRALLLQQYEKNPDLMLPAGMDDETYRKILNDTYKGDEARLVRELKSKGVTLEEYKRFITEELILAAMLSHFDKQIKAGWLAELRKGAVIEKVK